MEQTRLALGVLLFGVIQCVLLTLIATTPAVEALAGAAHPDIAGMRIGGDGLARMAPISVYGFLFYFVMLVQVCLMIALGVTPERRDVAFWIWLSLGFLISALAWWQMFDAYESFLRTGETEFIAGFPIAAAWLVYSIWLAGLFFVGLYVFGFRRYVWSDEDQQKFDLLLAKQQVSQEV